MLREISPRYVRQIKGESKRRWFVDDYFDLLIWVNKNNEIIGFQLCYDKLGDQRALTWRKGSGYMHHHVDEGEGRPGKKKATPILDRVDRHFEREVIADAFKKESLKVEANVSTFIYERILQYPSHTV